MPDPTFGVLAPEDRERVFRTLMEECSPLQRELMELLVSGAEPPDPPPYELIGTDIVEAHREIHKAVALLKGALAGPGDRPDAA